MNAANPRRSIYYWKCDRPAAFHGTEHGAAARDAGHHAAVGTIVRDVMGAAPVSVADGGGQGNHGTYLVTLAEGRKVFVRIEDGPEQDDYLFVESLAMQRARALGVPTPHVYATDASRALVPFAWQILDYIPYPDLNHAFKSGTLAVATIARQLGRLVATWQEVPVDGFGPFDVQRVQHGNEFHGYHRRYADYFNTRFEAHLDYLVARAFLTSARAETIRQVVDANRDLLELPHSCLVHKDLALWNVLGTDSAVHAVIDWDDCIAGDPLDDLSLLGCFHDGAFLREAYGGYAEVRPLPPEHVRRFWLHLLRNLLFKSVIRVGAGYFNHDSRFFLIGSGATGASLRDFTLGRIDAAIRGLRESADPFSL